MSEGLKVGQLVFACVRPADGLFPPGWRLAHVVGFGGVFDESDLGDGDVQELVEVELLDGRRFVLVPDEVKRPRPGLPVRQEGGAS